MASSTVSLLFVDLVDVAGHGASSCRRGRWQSGCPQLMGLVIVCLIVLKVEVLQPGEGWFEVGKAPSRLQQAIMNGVV